MLYFSYSKKGKRCFNCFNVTHFFTLLPAVIFPIIAPFNFPPSRNSGGSGEMCRVAQHLSTSPLMTLFKIPLNQPIFTFFTSIACFMYEGLWG